MAKVRAWSNRKDEFVKRAAFALLASLAGHDKRSGDEAYPATLPLNERAVEGERNFVKKGVSWALRAAAHELAQRLAAPAVPAARWVGNVTLRDLRRTGKGETR